MPVDLSEQNEGRILQVRVRGKLTHKDYQRFVPEFGRLAQKHGKVSILFEMDDFHGWKTAALWDDIRFDLTYFASIKRLAMVGDKRWQKWMSSFCRPFTTAEIRYFSHAESVNARRWLIEGPSSLPLRVFQTREQTKAYYDKISSFYDALADRSEAPVRKAGIDLLKARAGERILEIGFGTGHALMALSRAVGPGGIVYGLDLSERMVRLARRNLKEAGLIESVRLRCGDAAELPYAAETMDGVFMSFTLELFDTPEIPRVLKECLRVLRSGGRIVVVAMSREGEHEPFVGVFEWAHKHFPNFIDCRPIYARRSLEDAGFKIRNSLTKRMWIPVEIVLAEKT